MIMTLSMKKIVESRNRRGGASLHRNLLVAGVLFKARDVLLAADTADDSLEKSSAVSDETTSADVDADRKSAGDDDALDCERTAAEMTSPAVTSSSSLPANECSRLDDKENVAPDQPPRCTDDTVQLSTRAPLKRLSRDVVDDDVTPCKTTRSDLSADHSTFTECGKFHFTSFNNSLSII